MKEPKIYKPIKKLFFMLNFTESQKKELAEILNGMDKSISIDNFALFDVQKENFMARVMKILHLNGDEKDLYQKILKPMKITNAFSTSYLLSLNNHPEEAKKELEKARNLKKEYLSY